MIINNNFVIDELHFKDASSLNRLMVANADRFQSFFPKTLNQNLTLADSEAYIFRKQDEIQSKTEFTYALRVKKKGAVAGLIILKALDWDKEQGELAYCIDIKHEGKGWMTQTVNQVSNYAFADLRLRTLQIIVHKTNIGRCKGFQECFLPCITTLFSYSNTS
ncbi:MAG: GNAT family N-acetyltransferase, partial [Bacteroidota bacterium]